MPGSLIEEGVREKVLITHGGLLIERTPVRKRRRASRIKRARNKTAQRTESKTRQQGNYKRDSEVYKVGDMFAIS